MKLKLLLIAAVLVISSFNSRVLACSCTPPPPPSEAFKESMAVFVGKVVEAKEEGIEDDRILKVKFKVDTSWKHVKSQEVTIETDVNEALCGYTFETGKIYLVYTSQNSQQVLRTNLCSRTNMIANAEADMKFLKTLKPLWTSEK
jgi:CRISPR/Cas system-associated endonuclease/helicase Cas3